VIHLSVRETNAIVNVLTHAIAGMGVADDSDELIDDMLDNNTIEDVRKWAEAWDTAIAFHNTNCKPSAKYSDPWVVKELERELTERGLTSTL
jgi:hypothetical protein